MDVLMPQLGETVSEGRILKWLKSAGDPVQAGDLLFELETDKATVEVPAIVTGQLIEISVAIGQSVPVGSVVARIAEGEDSDSAGPSKQGPFTQRDVRTTSSEKNVGAIRHSEVITPLGNYGPARLEGRTFTPYARRLMQEAGVRALDVLASQPGPIVTGKAIKAQIVADSLRKGKSVGTMLATPQALRGREIRISQDLILDGCLALLRQLNASQSSINGGVYEIADLALRAWTMSLEHIQPANREGTLLMRQIERVQFKSTRFDDQRLKSLSAIKAERDQSAQFWEAKSGANSGVSNVIVDLSSGSATRESSISFDEFNTSLCIGGIRRDYQQESDDVKILRHVSKINLTSRTYDLPKALDLIENFVRLMETPIRMLV